MYYCVHFDTIYIKKCSLRCKKEREKRMLWLRNLKRRTKEKRRTKDQCIRLFEGLESRRKECVGKRYSCNKGSCQ